MGDWVIERIYSGRRLLNHTIIQSHNLSITHLLSCLVNDGMDNSAVWSGFPIYCIYFVRLQYKRAWTGEGVHRFFARRELLVFVRGIARPMAQDGVVSLNAPHFRSM